MTGFEIAAAVMIASTLYSGYMGQKQAEEQADVAKEARKAQERQAKRNRNALAEESFNKRRGALGLGQGGAPVAASGLTASQTGSVLTSVTNGNQASGL